MEQPHNTVYGEGSPILTYPLYYKRSPNKVDMAIKHVKVCSGLRNVLFL